ncbi:hypothetical protein VNI00_004702 [Paramarasmius palmivorus]|uniref:Uncharacterized protein n=1 Tax=Paramarasmius palmivorus TaxID=297713 RepID=A0AAW0DJ17_9AGAR
MFKADLFNSSPTFIPSLWGVGNCDGSGASDTCYSPRFFPWLAHEWVPGEGVVQTLHPKVLQLARVNANTPPVPAYRFPANRVFEDRQSIRVAISMRVTSAVEAFEPIPEQDEGDISGLLTLAAAAVSRGRLPDPSSADPPDPPPVPPPLSLHPSQSSSKVPCSHPNCNKARLRECENQSCRPHCLELGGCTKGDHKVKRQQPPPPPSSQNSNRSPLNSTQPRSSREPQFYTPQPPPLPDDVLQFSVEERRTARQEQEAAKATDQALRTSAMVYVFLENDVTPGPEEMQQVIHGSSLEVTPAFLQSCGIEGEKFAYYKFPGHFWVGGTATAAKSFRIPITGKVPIVGDAPLVLLSRPDLIKRPGVATILDEAAKRSGGKPLSKRRQGFNDRVAEAERIQHELVVKAHTAAATASSSSSTQPPPSSKRTRTSPPSESKPKRQCPPNSHPHSSPSFHPEPSPTLCPQPSPPLSSTSSARQISPLPDRFTGSPSPDNTTITVDISSRAPSTPVRRSAGASLNQAIEVNSDDPTPSPPRRKGKAKATSQASSSSSKSSPSSASAALFPSTHSSSSSKSASSHLPSSKSSSKSLSSRSSHSSSSKSLSSRSSSSKLLSSTSSTVISVSTPPATSSTAIKAKKFPDDFPVYRVHDFIFQRSQMYSLDQKRRLFQDMFGQGMRMPSRSTISLNVDRWGLESEDQRQTLLDAGEGALWGILCKKFPDPGGKQKLRDLRKKTKKIAAKLEIMDDGEVKEEEINVEEDDLKVESDNSVELL